MLVLTELRLAWRTPMYLVPAVGIPVLLLVIFGSIPSLTQPKKEFGGVSFFTIYTPSLIVLVLIMLSLLNLPAQMASYREQGVLHRMSTTPVPASALLGAQVAVNLIFAVVSIAMLLGVGAGAFNLVLPTQAAWLVLSLALTVAAMFGIGLCIAAFAGSPRVANVIGGTLLYPLAFFSGLWGPLSVYPGVIRQIAKALPSGAGFDAIHASLGGHFPGWAALGVLAAYAVVFSAIAVHWFGWDVERSHTRGGGFLELLTRSVTLREEVTGEQVARALRDALPSRFEVQPATRIKGRLFGREPTGPDVTLVTAGATGLWRAEVTVVQALGDTRVRVRPGGDPLYSALGVARKVRRVLRDLEAVAGSQATLAANGGNRTTSKRTVAFNALSWENVDASRTVKLPRRVRGHGPVPPKGLKTVPCSPLARRTEPAMRPCASDQLPWRLDLRMVRQRLYFP
jgi:ABC-2 type transport system permease protein